MKQLIRRFFGKSNPSRNSEKAGGSTAEPRSSELEILEPRMLFSAAPVEPDAAAEASAESESQEQAAEESVVVVSEQAAQTTAESLAESESTQEGPIALPTGSGQTGVSLNRPVTLLDVTPEASTLNQETLEAVAEAAADRWRATGLTAAQETALDAASYRIADLGIGSLARFTDGVITVDDDAAASGSWFIDSTLGLDEEFGADGSALAGTAAAGRHDLLAILIHEQGHLLGLDDTPGSGDAMDSFFRRGTRAMLEPDAAAGAVPGSLDGAHYAITDNNSDFAKDQVTNTLGFTVNSGTDRLLIVFVAEGGNDAVDLITDVSYNGSSLTFIGSAGLDNYDGLEAWYTILGTGATNIVSTITVTNPVDSGDGFDMVIAAVAYDGVHQGTPIDGFQTFIGGSSTTTLTNTVTSEANGDRVVGAGWSYDNPLVVGPDQTAIHNASTDPTAGVFMSSWELGTATPVDHTYTGGNGFYPLSLAFNVNTAVAVVASGQIKVESTSPATDVQLSDGDSSPTRIDLGDKEGTHFGSVDTASGSVTRDFLITNSGGADLTLTGVTLTGADASHFSVVQPASLVLGTNVGVDDTATFTVTYNPTADGHHDDVTLHIASDDPDAAEADFDFALEGIGTTAATSLVTQLGTAESVGGDEEDTITGFTVGAGNNRLLVVYAFEEDSDTITDVSFDGTSLTLLGGVSGGPGLSADQRVEVWYATMGSGAAEIGDVVMTAHGGNDSKGSAVAAVVYQNVDQSSPVEGFDSTFGTVNFSELVIASEAGDLVAGAHFNDSVGNVGVNDPTIPTIGAGTGQATVHDLDVLGNGVAYLHTTTEDGGVAIDTLFDWTNNQDSATLGFNINGVAAPDFGDAPDSYLTLVGSGGASHNIDPDIFMGAAAPDSDSDGFGDGTDDAPTGDAADDDTEGSDDEDGVASFAALTEADSSYSVDVTVTNNQGTGATLFGWIDFDRDGVFQADEGTSVAVADGTSAATATLNWTGLGTTADITDGGTFARFRLTTDGSITTSTPGGAATDGEVEDYALTIDPGFVIETTVAVVGSDLVVTDTNGGNTADDWTFTANGTNLTITDNNGNGIDLLGGLNGGTGDGTDSVTVALSSFSGGTLDINSLAGDDAIEIGTLTLLSGQSIDVDGGAGTGDDVTVTGAVSTGTGSVTVNVSRNVTVSANVTTTGAGAIDIDAGRSILVDSGAVVSTVNGGIDMDANVAGTASGNFFGLYVNGTTIRSTGTGNISLTGSGGDSLNGNLGINVKFGGTVESTASGVSAGTITLVGTGGNGTGGDLGVAVDLNSKITSVDGDISVTGSGGNGAGSFNVGVILTVNGDVKSTGTGSIAISGTGGVGADSHGVRIPIIFNAGSEVTTVSGNISITGESSNSDDILLENTTTGISSASGNITLTVDDITIGGNVSSTGGDLLITPRTFSTTIGVGAGATGDLNIDNTEIGFLQDGFNSIAIGSIFSGSGAVDVNSSTFLDSIIISGASITVTELDAGANDVSLNARITDIVDGGDAGTDVTGAHVSLLSTVGIGSDGDQISLAADTLEISSVGTDAYLSEADTVTLANTSIVSGTVEFQGGGTFELPAGDMFFATELRVSNGSTLEFQTPDFPFGPIPITVENGGTLSGVGTTTEAVTVETGGTIAPGLSPGVIASGNLNIDGDYEVEIGGTSPGTGAGFHDQIDVTGTVTIGSTGALNESAFGGYSPSGGEQFVIINNDGGDAVSGTFNGLAEGGTVSTNFLGSGLTATISYLGIDAATGNDVVITVAAAPTGTTALSLDGGGNLVVEDDLGDNTDDNLSITRSGGFFIVEDLDGNTVGAAIGGAVQVSPSRVDVPDTAVTGGVIVNTLGGDDTVTIGDLGTLAGELTVDGGAGEDSIIQTGYATLTGASAVDYDAEQIAMESGSSLTTGSGDVDIDGTGRTGSGPGVRFSAASITSTSGNVNITGEGGDSGHYNRGILLSSIGGIGSTISTGGAVTLDGTGGTTGVHATGVSILGSTVESTGAGPVTITGQGGSGSFFNNGVTIHSFSTIDSGTGDLLIDGSGGSTGAMNRGVFATNSDLLSNGGNIEIIGTGEGTSFFGVGVELDTVDTTTTGSGTVTIRGTGATGTLGNMGVKLANGSTVNTVDGAIEMRGTGNGSSTGNHGVQLATNVAVSATGSGTVMVRGLGGAGTLLNHGVQITTTSTVSAAGGLLTVTGSARGTLSLNKGVEMINSDLSNSGSGNIALTGTGSDSGTGVYNTGIQMTGGGITTDSGNITIDGLGGEGTTLNEGVRIVNSTVASTGSGTLSLIGVSQNPGTTGVYNTGMYLLSMSLNTGGTINVTGTGGAGTLLNHGVYMQNVITTGTVPVPGGTVGLGSLSLATTGNFFP